MPYAEERADACAPQSEFPRPTHDGMLWPVDRRDMQDRHAIVLRMSRDLNQLRREDGAVSAESLAGQGWLPGQIKSHLADALELAASSFSVTKQAPVESDFAGAL